ncbi:unnamed protein product [Chondrus crispus]|uniref:Uncharacterized protein n=1 Tax=Chondrus crispus TaxID=2769 RepID=R7QQ74_CHOCR|nr:unnamed protein product [Chondrus crispus]CDF40647.1 unnamed protein product [Chondrus crispus]|eukprot:XP_005710941.1 unnamed protein product [Chondrus crispus]
MRKQGDQRADVNASLDVALTGIRKDRQRREGQARNRGVQHKVWVIPAANPNDVLATRLERGMRARHSQQLPADPRSQPRLSGAFEIVRSRPFRIKILQVDKPAAAIKTLPIIAFEIGANVVFVVLVELVQPPLDVEHGVPALPIVEPIGPPEAQAEFNHTF